MAAYEVLLLNTAIPQIQAAQSGDTYVVPRDIQITANLDVTGNTTLGDASTDTVRVNGYMGVGGAGTANAAVYLTSTALTGTSQYGFYSTPRASSAATSQAAGFTALVRTEAAAFTLANAYGLSVENVTKGAGSTITNQHGVYISDQTNGTNNFGITSQVSSGTDKWNIYASGTAANYFAGNVGIGATNPIYKLEVNGGASDAMSLFNSTNANGAHLRFAASGAIKSYIGGAPGFIGSSTADDLGIRAVGSILFATAGSGVDMTLDTSGNLGLGVTPIAWSYKSLAVGFGGSAISTDAIDKVQLGANFYRGSGADRFAGTGRATLYQQDAGEHKWLTSTASGTAGNTISFTQAMTLDASGNLGVGTPNPTAIGSYNSVTVNGTSGSLFDLYAGGTLYGRIRGTANVMALLAQGVSSVLTLGTNNTERARITSVGNFKLGGTADRATTVGTNHLDIFNGTAPVGTLTDGISIYSSSGEAYVMDAAGNATLFSPHDAETNEWIFKSKHTPTGKVLKIDVERLLKFVNDHFGLDAVHEFVEE